MISSASFFRMARHLLTSLFTLFASVALAADPYGLTTRPSFSAFNGGKLPTSSERAYGDWSTEDAFPNLTFQNPLGLAQMPGTTKLVVWEREGRVYSFEKDAATTTKTLMLDITGQTQGWDDSGLVGLAFHPNFATNHYVFLYYTYVTPGSVEGSPTTRPPTNKPNRDRLSRFTVKSDGTIDPASETVFVDQISVSLWHNGGGLLFHPDDGFLYFTNGDDENNRAQILNDGLHSGVFRIDVDQRGGSISHAPVRALLPAGSVGANYYIPNDNPFVGKSGVLEEFFCLGLRSPHRMTVDPVSKRIFIGDVGEATREEIDVIEPGEKGLNFQWNVIEGYGGDLPASYAGISRRPMLDYLHSDGGSAVIGGYVYRGSEFPELVGKYIFGDNGTRKIYYADESTTPGTRVLLATMPLGAGPNSGNDYTGLSSFGVDDANELYLCQLSSTGGHIYKLSRTVIPAQPMPATLSATGVFTDLVNLVPSAGFVSYDVNTPLWSDGAVKRRWFAVPSGTNVAFTPTGEWTFPTGSVFVKHFELPVNDANPNVRKRLETRVLVRNDAGYVYGGSYKWRADGTDADLVLDPLTEEETITQADRTTRKQRWVYPGRQDCLTCHNTASSGVLGLNTPQSNRAHLFPETGATDNQLRAWNHAGYFSSAPNESDIPTFDKLAAIDDPTASVEKRARSYLDANCAHCHRPSGAPVAWDARIETPLADAGIINGRVSTDYDVVGARVIVPRSITKSILHRRIASLTTGVEMPPLAKNVIDRPALALIDKWINSLDLLAPWQSNDVGATAIAGSAIRQDDAFTVFGSGDDIWDQRDAFQFIHRDLNGDGQLLARVTFVKDTNEWAKAGVMIRESLDPGAKHAMTIMSPEHGVAFQYRDTTGGISDGGSVTAATPIWVRIERKGNEIISYLSPDGTSWAENGRKTIAMAKKVQIGLCFTAHNNSTLGQATFDNVTFLPTTPYAILNPPQSTLARAGDSVTFAVGTVGDTPSSYQWSRNNVSIPGATGSTLTLQNVGLQQAGGFRVMLGKGLLSSVAVLNVVGDAQFDPNPAPGSTATLSISAVGTGITYQWLKNDVPITGDSRIGGARTSRLVIKSFNGGDVAQYKCVATAAGASKTLGPYTFRLLNPPAISSGTPPSGIISGALSWQLSATEPATTFTVKGLPTGLRYDRLTNRIVGTPEVSGDFTVTVIAQNAAGKSVAQDYTLHVQAFPTAIVGSFTAPVPRSAGVNGQLGGLLRFTVGKSGTLSGKLLHAADPAIVLKGRVVAAPSGGAALQLSLPRKAGALTLALSFDTTSGAPSGSLALGASSVALQIKRVLDTTTAATIAAAYNTRLRAPGGTGQPEGSGWLRVSVARSGEVTAAGRLPDGTKVSFGSVLAADRTFPIYFPLYSGHGSALGAPAFVGGQAEFSGSVDWQKFAPINAADRNYAGGINAQLAVLGRSYQAPALGAILLGLPNAPDNAQIEFTGAGLNAAAQGSSTDQTFRLMADGTTRFAPAVTNPCAVIFTVAPATGTFSGSFQLKDGSTVRRSAFTGIFVPGETTAEGQFTLPQLPTPATGPILSGSVSVHAP